MSGAHNNRQRWADIDVESSDEEAIQSTQEIVGYMTCSTVTNVDGGNLAGLPRRGTLEEIEGLVVPPLRINRINVKSLDNFRTKAVMFNARVDTLGWLRSHVERTFGIPP